MKTAVSLLLTCSALLGAGHASAGLVSAVSATSDMGNRLGGVSLANAINGSGLSSLSLSATHAATIPSNSWASAVGTTTGNITFTLGGDYLLDGFSFWNQNNGGPGGAGSTGLQRVEVLTSTDGVSFDSWFTTAFLRESGDTSAAQLENPSDVVASYVRFHVLSNYGDSSSGFAEIQFDGASCTQVNCNRLPEPESVALVAVSLGALGVARRRRQA